MNKFIEKVKNQYDIVIEPLTYIKNKNILFYRA